jgi:hypothetical protein
MNPDSHLLTPDYWLLSTDSCLLSAVYCPLSTVYLLNQTPSRSRNAPGNPHSGIEVVKKVLTSLM